MAPAAQLGAEDLVLAFLRRLEPEVGNHAGHAVHLGAELRHEEVVQHVVGAQQRLVGLIHRQMHGVGGDEHVVVAARIVRIHAEGVVGLDVAHVHGAELAVFAGEAERPLPLLRQHLELLRFLRHVHVVVPDDQPRRQHGHHAHRGDDGERPLQARVLRLVLRPRILSMAVLPQAVDHEQAHRHEHHAAHPEGDEHRGVDAAPVRGDVHEPPRADEREEHRSHDQDQQKYRYRHVTSSLAVGTGRTVRQVPPRPTATPAAASMPKSPVLAARPKANLRHTPQTRIESDCGAKAVAVQPRKPSKPRRVCAGSSAGVASLGSSSICAGSGTANGSCRPSAAGDFARSNRPLKRGKPFLDQPPRSGQDALRGCADTLFSPLQASSVRRQIVHRLGVDGHCGHGRR